MLQELNEKVSIISIYNKDKGSVMPYRMKWNNDYVIFKELTYHHLVRQGRLIIHVFHLTDGIMDYRLHLYTDTLHWKLIEVSDGNA